MKKEKELEVILVIVLGLLIVYKIFAIDWLFLPTIILGLLGTFFAVCRKYIALGWMKIGFVLNLIIPKILLGIIFYLILFPLSLISRVFRKESPIVIKKPKKTNYASDRKEYGESDFLNTW